MPGEWYLDRASGRLYLWPPAWQNMQSIVVSVLEDAMISLNGTSHVTIRGLTLECMRGAAVVVGGGENNLVAGCVIRNAGQGIILAGGFENGVAGCDIHGLHAMGLRMTGGDRPSLRPGKHFAVNNHIHSYALQLKTWQPGIKVEGVGHRVAHNHIHHAPQYAISYEGNDHVFEYNDMHDLCLEMSDVGVIGCGTDWTYRGNVIRHNFIHHIPVRPYPGVIGVYLDNCASSADIVGNVFYSMEKSVMIGGESIVLAERVPTGHKLALVRIAGGEKVVKYGFPIGSATVDVHPGEYVHTHNLKSDYLPTYTLDGSDSYLAEE